MARTCAICGQSESLPHRTLVFEGWILWPDGTTLCPFCRDQSHALAAVRARARDLRRIAAHQRQLASRMLEWSAAARAARALREARDAQEMASASARAHRTA